MFRPIFIYTLKTLVRRKKQFFGAILVISLCIMLVLTVLSTSSSIKKSLNDYLVYRYGLYSAVVEVTPSTTQILSKYEIRNAGTVLRLGTVDCIKSIYDNQLTIGTISESASSIMPIHLIEGSLPHKLGEVAVEQSISEKLGMPIAIGETILLSISLFTGKTTQIELTVSGIIENYAAYCNFGFDETFWPSLIISEEQIQPLDKYKKYAVVGLSKNELESFVSEDDLNIYINPRYCEGNTIAELDTSTSVLLTIAATCTVLIACICLLAYFFLTRVELQEHIHNLKLIGARQEVLILFVFLRTCFIFLPSLILGLLAWAGVFSITSDFLLSQFFEAYTAMYSLPVVIISGIAVLVMMLFVNMCFLLVVWRRKPLHSNNSRTFSRYSINTKNIFTKWILLSISHRKKTYTGLILAMAICYLIVVFGVMFSTTIRVEYEKTHFDDYKITAQHGGYISFFNIPLFPYYGISNITLQKLMTNGEVKHVSYMKQLNVVIEDRNQDLDLHTYFGCSIREESEQYDGDYELLVRDFNLNPENNYYRVRLIETDSNLLSLLLQQEKIKGNQDVLQYTDGKHIALICPDIQACPYEIGDSINIFQAILQDGGHFSPEKCDMLECEVTVSAIIQIDERDSYIGSKFYSNPAFKLVWGPGSFAANGIALNNEQLYISLENIENRTTTENALEQIKYSLPDAQIVSRIDAMIEEETLLKTMGFSITCLVIFIGATSILMYINVVQKKYAEQRRLWGILRAIGLTKTTAIIYQAFETILIFGSAATLNLLLLGFMRLLPLRRDVFLLSPLLICTYVVFAIIAFGGTLPIIIPLFKDRIVNQLELVE